MTHKFKAGDIFKLNGQETEPDFVEVIAVSPTLGAIENEEFTYCYFIKEVTFYDVIYSAVPESFLDVYCTQSVVQIILCISDRYIENTFGAIYRQLCFFSIINGVVFLTVLINKNNKDPLC